MESYIHQEKKIRYDIIHSMFMIFDYLLENNSLNLVIFFIIYFLETLQILYFFLNPLFADYWSNSEVFTRFSSFLKYFWITKIFEVNGNFSGYLIFFYLFIGINLITYADCIYMVICLRRNYTIPVISRYILSFIINIFLPILLIPMLDSFLAIFICNSDPTNSSKYYILFYPYTECLSGIYFIHLIFSICGMAMVLFIGNIMSTIYYETNPKSKNIKARFPSSYERFMFLSKILWVVVFQFSMYFDLARMWICNVINLFCSLVNFVHLIRDKPYFNHNAQKILLIFRTIEFITSLILTLNLILGIGEFEGDWLIFFIGGLLAIVIHIMFPENKFSFIIETLESIRDEFFLQKKLVYTLDFLDSHDSLANELFLKGFIITHPAKSSQSSYLNNLKQRVESIAKSPQEKSKKHAEEYVAYIKYIDECYQKGLRKFPSSNSLRLSYLLFSIRYLKNPQISMMIIKQIDQSTLTIEDNFILFRYSRTVEERLMIHNPHAMRVDINFEITYKRNKSIFLKLIEFTTRYLIEFWDLISRDTFNVSVLEDLIYKININLESISAVWKEIQQLKTNDIKLLVTYEKFLKNVLNDDQGCEELMSKYVETQPIGNEENLLGEYVSYIQDGSGYVLASGNSESIGKILSSNATLAKAFHYTLEELKKLNTINDLMPELYRGEHTSRLLTLAITDEYKEKKMMGFSRAVAVGLSKTGYIFPINLTMTVIMGLNDAINFLTLIRTPPSDNFKHYPIYFLTDASLLVRNVSSQAIPIFGINSNNVCIKNRKGNQYLDITVLIKDLQGLKENPSVISEYKTENGMSHKRRIRIEEINEVINLLQESAEKNKAVKIMGIDIISNKYIRKIMCDKKGNEVIVNRRNVSTPGDSSITPKFDKSFKDFFISLNEVKFGNKLLGYIIKLEPIKEENILIDTKNVITYDENHFTFSHNKCEFREVGDIRETRPEIAIPQVFAKSNRRDSLKKNRKIVDDPNMNSAIVNFIREKRVINYAMKHNVKSIILIPGKSHLDIPKSMKIEESLRLIEEIMRISKGNDIDLFEEDKSEEQSLLEKSTSDLLNFKGIEGWQMIINKIKKNKIPTEISILRIVTIMITLIKIILMILYYSNQSDNMHILEEINTIQNLTMQHTSYLFNSIHLGEMFMYYQQHLPSMENEFRKVNLSLNNNIDIITNITNSFRLIQGIQNKEFGFNDNRTFLLLNHPGLEQMVTMNLFEIFLQLINKLYAFSHVDYVVSNVEDDYLLFFKNSNNVYLVGILDVVTKLNQSFLQKVTEIEKQVQEILLIALIMMAVCVLNTVYSLKIRALKQKAIDLFFTIPQKVCWKYYNNCENFLKYLLDDDGSEIKKVEENEQEQNAISVNKDSFNNTNNLNLVSSNRTNKPGTSQFGSVIIIQLVLVNLLLFGIDYSYYGLHYLSYNSYTEALIGIEQFKKGMFTLNSYLNIYSINQRQIYTGSNYDIMYTSNQELQKEMYKQIAEQIDKEQKVKYQIV